MTPERQYSEILANLSNQTPLDLDRVLFEEKASRAPGDPSRQPFPPSVALWEKREEEPSYIGLRIKEPIEEPAFLAARLASIALERHVYPVFISYIARSGMQQFGFRVEQVTGLSEEAQQEFERQLSRFWNFALLIDASDINLMG